MLTDWFKAIILSLLGTKANQFKFQGSTLYFSLNLITIALYLYNIIHLTNVLEQIIYAKLVS